MKPKNPTKYRKALTLRLKGKSYREITKALGVPKSTQNVWFSNLELPLSVQKILKEKDRLARKQFVEFNRKRTHIIQDENQKIKESAFKEINLLSKYELMLIGTVLYWTEGYKIEKQRGTPQICFANSDPYMIALFLRFLREIIKIPEKKFSVCVHIYPSIDERSAIDFWANVTNIPRQRFRIVQQISRASKGKRPKNSLPFGTLKLNISDRRNSFRIKGWIDGLKHQSGLS